MKRFAVLLTLMAAMLYFGTSVYAVGIIIDENGTSEAIGDLQELEEPEIIELEGEISASVFWSVVRSASDNYFKYYYDQLDGLHQYTYNYLKNNIDSLMDGSSNYIMFKIPDDYQDDLTSSFEYFKSIYAYLIYDYSEKYWLDHSFKVYTLSYSDGNYGLLYGFGTVNDATTISELEFSVYADPYSVDTVEEENTNVENKVDEILALIPENATTYKKLQIINDWLIDNNSYNPYVASSNDDEASPVAWMLTSALLYGDGEDTSMYPVCEGYAEAFQYICKRLGIESVILRSSDHEWNAVKMNDGNWYNVDVTHNDPIITSTDPDVIAETISNYRYKHFLKGSSNTYINNSHHVIVSEKGLTAPEISTSDYVYQNTGDTDMDGILEKEDAALVLKYISGMCELTSEQINSGDIDSDGELTIMDAVKILSEIQ